MNVYKQKTLLDYGFPVLRFVARPFQISATTQTTMHQYLYQDFHQDFHQDCVQCISKNKMTEKKNEHVEQKNCSSQK